MSRHPNRRYWELRNPVIGHLIWADVRRARKPYRHFWHEGLELYDAYDLLEAGLLLHDIPICETPFPWDQEAMPPDGFPCACGAIAFYFLAWKKDAV